MWCTREREIHGRGRRERAASLPVGGNLNLWLGVPCSDRTNARYTKCSSGILLSRAVASSRQAYGLAMRHASIFHTKVRTKIFKKALVTAIYEYQESKFHLFSSSLLSSFSTRASCPTRSRPGWRRTRSETCPWTRTSCTGPLRAATGRQWWVGGRGLQSPSHLVNDGNAKVP